MDKVYGDLIKDKLNLNQNRFHSMIEDMTEIVEIESLDNTLIFVNDAYCRYFGKVRDKLVGSNAMDLIYPEDRQKVQDRLNGLTPEKPSAESIEARIIKANGEIGWMSWTARGFFNESGEIIGHQSVGRDVTDIKKYQEQLKLSEARYRGIVEDQTELIVRITPDDIILFANDVYCRFFNGKLDDLIGTLIAYDIIDIEPGKNYPYLSPDSPVNVCQEKIRTPEGQIAWIEWTARGIFNQYHELIEIQKVGRNITDRKEAEAALHKAKEELEIRVQERTVELSKANRGLTILNNNMKNIFSNIPAGVIVADETGKVSNLNNYLKRFWGDVTEEINDIISRYIIEKKKPYLTRLFNEHKSFQDIEFVFPFKSGDIHCLMSGIYMENQGSGPKSGVILIRTIKEIHKLVNRFSGATARVHFNDIVSVNEEMCLAIKNAKQAAAGTGNILITGESGTGKEMFAQAIHNQSERARGPFVAVNCGAIPRELLGSELFGYAEGAFTGAKKGGNPGKFELASGGTIFLDEIGDMPIDQQVALLRVVQEKCFIRIGGTEVIPTDVRIICATNQDLLMEIEKGDFRADLYYRLNVINVNIPPLRERPEDVPVLFKYFMTKSEARWKYDIKDMDPQIMYYLQRYDWPGNVRELHNIVERLLHHAEGAPLSIKHLPVDIYSTPVSSTTMARTWVRSLSKDRQGRTIKEIREENKKLQETQESKEIIKLLNQYRGNISKVARELGIARSTLYAKMEKFQIR
ncbi:MAG: sigma 54-interacting transcriptional regulator [Syntrophomonadaceae bacterium]|nr:sigma 54-interacting transcriptional regulator [Syntrophomonadaceae bacterium]MDD3889603.1 sigma 54-interacting transcriptional regulator [Syntrophomonadaceae bacterium]MDD4550348.1 sigma 54-interacting transcriptional regulator [Syntrophomonadaceae bacterium]